MYSCKLCPPPLGLFQVPGVSLDGLFDAEQHRGQPLVQARHRVELLDGLRERLAVLLLVSFEEFLWEPRQTSSFQAPGPPGARSTRTRLFNTLLANVS